MSGAALPDITEAHAQIVRDILRAHLPECAHVWVFGSRATGRARAYSDLDLAIDAGRRLTLDEAAMLREAFSDSDLPYRVDIVDWHALDVRFRRVIADQFAPIPPAQHPTRPDPVGGA
jgi:predicted nucleotidyltransferase